MNNFYKLMYTVKELLDELERRQERIAAELDGLEPSMRGLNEDIQAGGGKQCRRA